MKLIDLTGQRFGKLTVIKRAQKPQNRKRKGTYWLCQCDCGKTNCVIGCDLKTGKVKSCGCLVEKDYVGKRFGSLLAIERIPRYYNHNTGYKCVCDCGNICIKLDSSLVTGNIKSCGCQENKRKINDVEFKFGERVAYLSIKGCPKKAKIDIENYDRVKQYYWSYDAGKYVYTKVQKNGFSKTIYLHRLIMGNTPHNLFIDHIDGNTLNNTRNNLRFVTKQQNSFNRCVSCLNKSGVTGVRKESKKKWVAQICFNGKNIRLGLFENFEDAVKARMEAEKKYFGEYRRKTNGSK